MTVALAVAAAAPMVAAGLLAVYWAAPEVGRHRRGWSLW